MHLLHDNKTLDNIVTLLFQLNLACATFLVVAACSAASAAPSGTFTVTYPAATVGNAILTIVPTPPNTKVQITCPNLINGVVAATVSIT